MKILLSMLLLCCVVSARGDAANVETIVCVRHGEKPQAGLGQLDCRGLNRALALPKVLLAKFGTPEFVFAPNPSEKSEKGRYNYVRPLMTIEPTAIRCGLPVNTQYGASEINGLEGELEKPEYQKSTIFVAWEHTLMDAFVINVVKKYGGDPAQVPPWSGKDFDTIFVVKITRAGDHNTVVFSVDHEGLNDLSDVCP